ncbi:helix-turn-helix domain-containing protein [Ferrovibrio sp.]|uniref:helix-turn-helix domain-containing protein n=1 Tax=Ferrovibrio sp. TaxID=1917215 RepID=UPI003530335D
MSRIAQHISSGLGARRLARVLEYIDENLSKPINYAVLSQVAALNRSRLGAAFKISMGITPHQYIIARRIDKAKTLLCNTELSMAEIAIAVGFSSQSHMTSHFRRQVGTTPAKFRQQGCAVT